MTIFLMRKMFLLKINPNLFFFHSQFFLNLQSSSAFTMDSTSESDISDRNSKLPQNKQVFLMRYLEIYTNDLKLTLKRFAKGKMFSVATIKRHINDMNKDFPFKLKNTKRKYQRQQHFKDAISYQSGQCES